MSVRLAAGILSGALIVALWLAAGIGGVLYVVLFAAAAAPGIPLGIALFGPRHPGAWAGGALVGYGLTQLALWAVIAAGLASTAGFLMAWLLVLAGAYGLSRLIQDVPVLPAGSWTAADVRALLLVLVLVPVLMGITYRNVGREDSQGNRYYRAYFTADFLWHCSLAHELGKFTLPPRNPYLAPRPINYYWTYFLLPAATASLSPASPDDGRSVEQYLKANAILAGLLMVAALFVLVHSATSSALCAGLAVVLALIAASAEGTYATLDLLRRGRPLQGLLDINIDAVTAWPPFRGLRIDNIPRSLWYTPQHTTSIALGLVGLTIGIFAGAFTRTAGIVGAGLALGLSTTMNPLLGAVCSIVYGVCVLADGLGKAGGLVAIARHALAAVFVAGAVAWGAASRVMDGAGAVLDVGFAGYSRNYPLITLLLALGPVLLPAVAGVLMPARTPAVRRAIVVGASGVALGLFLLYFVRISEASWVGFRAGQLLLISIPILLARTLESLSRTVRAALVAVVLVIGMPTTLIDTYNAQDIGNRRPGPGFRWTLWTTPAQREAFIWIRAHTTDEDIVQMEPIVRGREHWTLIPSFAGRRMAAGQPISLLPLPEYRERSEQVRRLFEARDQTEAAAIARSLRLDYLYVDTEDVRAYPEGTQKFAANPEIFEPVFANGEVRIYRVR
jgi:hypothetical protein